MKKSIKNLAFTMILFTFCLVMTLSVSAEISGDYEYTVLDDGTISITGYTGSEANLVIPSEIDGMDVTKIGNSAFYQNATVESVEIPDSITEIGKLSFYGCGNLTEATIGESVAYIGTGAFKECVKLEGIVIPDSVKRIGAEAFYGCSALAELSIGESVEIIGWASFRHCSSLTEIVIPDSTKKSL